MIEKEFIDAIRRRTETANVDYKAGFEWSKANKDQQFELIKDMIGMANTRDGGMIILGVDGTVAV